MQNQLVNKALGYYEQNFKQLRFAMTATFLWGMAAHAYCFFDNSVSHDSLNEFHGAILGNNIKMSSGRVFTSLYRDLFRSDVTLPWLIGLLSLLWLGITVFFLIRLFQIDSKILTFLTAGILTANLSFSATAATYLHDLDCYMFAVLCATVAVFLWRQASWGWLAGIVFVTITLGIYQAYLFVAVTLVIMVSLLDLLDGRNFQTVFLAGMKAICMILLGGGLYYLAMKVRLHYAGLQLYNNDYNSLYLLQKMSLAELPGLVWAAYCECFHRLWNGYSAYPKAIMQGITLFLGIAGMVSLIVSVRNIRGKTAEIALTLLLLVLLPLGMCMIYVLTKGYVHVLMVYPVWFAYLFILLLALRLSECWKHWIGQCTKILCMVLMALLLYGNVQFANGMYLKKDMEYDAYLSLMTRIVTRMEMQQDYQHGQTPVVFVGLPERNRVLNAMSPGFEGYWEVTGLESTDVIFMPEPNRFQAYFDYVLNIPIQIADADTWTAILSSDLAAQMPAYPADGFLAMEDGVLIVKLGRAPNEK